MVPGVHVRTPRRLLAAPLAAAGLLAAVAAMAGEEERSLSRAVYEFAVTGYCGLADPAVEAGFQAEVAALTARDGLDAESARRQRIRGWIAAEEEWRNRGLGGNRAWCAGEGAEAARHFRDIAEGRLQP
jgi:hypothetical protein